MNRGFLCTTMVSCSIYAAIMSGHDTENGPISRDYIYVQQRIPLYNFYISICSEVWFLSTIVFGCSFDVKYSLVWFVINFGMIFFYFGVNRI